MIPKFRVWDTFRKKWVEHFYITENGIIYNMTQMHTDRIGAVPIEKSDFIVMQSTGVFDKNRVEIFDKDIIRNKDGRLAIVKWHGIYASFVYIWLDELDKNKQDWHPLFLAYMKFEVVGNVYQHPELIEEANNVVD